jgi:pimeloyl-ACP methyl ester carboxylesterase
VSSTYLLLPGAGGESWYWHRVVPQLRALGREVLAPDLPAGDESAGLAEHAEVALEAVGDRERVVVAAQSMGAFIGPMVCERADVALLALVCPMIPAPGESAGEWWAATGQPAARREQDLREGRDPDAPLDPIAGFFHDVPEETRAEALQRGEPPQADRPFGDPWPLERWPDVPTRVLAGSHDRLFPLEFMRALARDRLGVEVDVIDTGHLAALAKPGELVAWLERCRSSATA